jgi:hypothetical protein
MPSDRPIYFSVDFNATAAQLPAIADYFHGVATVLGLDRVGVYGGFNVIEYLAIIDAARWFWQTYAWSGGNWSIRAHIRQVRNGVSFQGADIDLDTAMESDYGQWMVGVEPGPIVNPPSPKPTWTETLIMNLPTLTRGAKGAYVGRLQALLNVAGSHLVVDRDFGPLTESAVRSYQSQHSLAIDGIVGQHTWTSVLTA